MLKKIFAVGSLFMLFAFLTAPSLRAQQTANVTVNASIQGILILLVDGTDTGNNLLTGNYSTSETCDFGDVDALGTAIANGDTMVNSTTGIPVDSTGNLLSSPYDLTCVGSFYPILSATGGNSATDHSNSALGIFALGVQAGGTDFSLDVSAQLTTNSTNVSIDQLKWKDDGTASTTYENYTDFSTSLTNISSTTGIFFRTLLFHDYGILVEYEDAPGQNTWTVTYTLSAI